MKRCFKCGCIKPMDEFYRHSHMKDGHLGKCKQCTRLDTVKNRAAKLEYYQDYDRKRQSEPSRVELNRNKSKRYSKLRPDARYAHGKVSRAVKSGELQRMPCEFCGSPDSVAHHSDYAKPLDVHWFCHKHHCAVHRKYDYRSLISSCP